MIYTPLVKLSDCKIIPHVDVMCSFIREHNLPELPEGKTEILGQDLYLRVFKYFPYDERERQFETHRVYGDVHFILRGVEKIQTVGGEEHLMPATSYDEKKDIQFFTTEQDITDIILREGDAAIFFPGESHRPMCRLRELSEPILKYVFKFKC